MNSSKQNGPGQGLEFLTNLILRVFFGLAMLLPYRARLAFMGWLTSHVIFPMAGHSQRMRDNLSYIFPDLSEPEIKQLLRKVPDNFGRTLIEEYSGQQFVDRVRPSDPVGPGFSALCEARDQNRPAVIVSAHFGNYDAMRASLIIRGFRVGGLYRPFNNRRFDRHYKQALETIGTPIFPRSRRGEADMLRFLKSGGMVALLNDQHMGHGAPLTFFGKPAATALSAAKIALKYNALLVPAYATRQKNGLDFTITFEEPITHSTPETMTQALNDSLESHVQANMGQWLWSHRRWKLSRKQDKG